MYAHVCASTRESVILREIRALRFRATSHRAAIHRDTPSALSRAQGKESKLKYFSLYARARARDTRRSVCSDAQFLSRCLILKIGKSPETMSSHREPAKGGNGLKFIRDSCNEHASRHQFRARYRDVERNR